MTRIRAIVPFLLTLTTMLLFAAWLAVGAAGFKVENKGTTGLDGRVVMSPAAERVTTIEPGTGALIGPGVTVQRAIILQNRSKEPIDFDLDVAHVVGSTAELIVDVRHGVREGAAGWVTLERPTVRLRPGDQAQIGLTIRIPKGIKPGSKSFAVTATQRAGSVQSTGAGIAPQFKQDAIFIIDLPGDAPIKAKFVRADITSASKSLEATHDGKTPPVNSRWYIGPDMLAAKPHRLTLTTLYANEGERLLTPSGTVVIRDVFGRVAGRWDIRKFTVYPDGEAGGQVELKGLPSLGIFQTKVSLESEGGTQVTTLPRFVMVPWWFIFAVAGFVGYLLLHVLKWRLRRRRDMQRYLAEVEAAGPGENGDDAAAWDYDAADDEVDGPG